MGETRPRAVKGRGATFNPENRFRRDDREAVDDGWQPPDEDEGDTPPPKTIVTIQNARTIIARNDSPDIPFDRSINPYQGCEHGCVYCYARPTHAYLDLSPGLDFETRLFAKPNAAALLRAELAKPGYRCEPMALGTNTDPYQPIEREWRITRQVLEVLSECDHPVTITTKGVAIERDLDLLSSLAARKLVHVQVSIAMLDRELARKIDPRAPAPQRRLEMIRALAGAGVPVGVNVAPVIPQLTDKDLEAILEAAAAHGARSAMWVMLRLPREVAPLFRDWLEQHHPLRARHVMSLVQQLRGGRDNDPGFGSRMRGEGQFAELIERRFAVACRRLGLDAGRGFALERSRFRPPKAPTGAAQLDLF
ncbi:MAG TPA: PA0069 family radical SAM protein [Casimicrobiaceae bacterium]|nr:PA0069 family radical SAM protein [Casimicrobiaceae bacterium]